MKLMKILMLISMLVLAIGCGSEDEEGGSATSNNPISTTPNVNNGAPNTSQTENINTLRSYVSNTQFQSNVSGRTFIQITHKGSSAVASSCDFLGIDFDCQNQQEDNNLDRSYIYRSGETDILEGVFTSRAAIRNYLLNRVLSSTASIQVSYQPLQSYPLAYNISRAYGSTKQDPQLVILRHFTGEIFVISFDVPLEANPIYEGTFNFVNGQQSRTVKYLDNFSAF